MLIKSPIFKKDDGTKVIICLYLFNNNHKGLKYRVWDIEYCEPRKHKYNSFNKFFQYDFDYNRLNQGEKWKYSIKKYIEFVGEKKLKQAIIFAWKSLKPADQTLIVAWMSTRPNINEILYKRN